MKKPALIFLLLSAFFCSRAQTNHLYFDKLDIQKGLPESFVRAIVEDAEGYIWIATQNGLVRYDGYNYKVYNLGSDAKNVTSVTNIFSILADSPHKTIWVSTAGNGIFRYNPAKDIFDQFSPPSKKEFQYIQLKTVDAGGNIWGNINEDGIVKLFRLDAKSGRYERFSNLEKGNYRIGASQLFGVHATKDGKVWIGTNNGLYGYNGAGKKLTVLLASTDSAATIGLNPLYQAPSQRGALWANVFHSHNLDLRVSCIDLKTGKIIRQYRPAQRPDSLNDARVNAIFEDKRQRLWFATYSGFSKLDRQNNKFTNYQSPDTAVREMARVAESADGKFWASANGALVYFDPDKGTFQSYKPNRQPGGLSSRDIAAKLVDRTNTLWLGLAYAGANRVSKIKSAFETISLAVGIQDASRGEMVHVVAAEADRTWLATKDAIYIWRNKTGQLTKAFGTPQGQRITDIFADGDIFYIGTGKGFIVYNTASGQKQTYLTKPNDSTSITVSAVTKVFKDHEGIVWLGMGYDQGICSFDPKTKKFRRFPFHVNYDKLFNTNDGALDDGRVITIYEDRQNTLWVGTNAGSLNKYNRKTGMFFSYYNKRNEKMSCISDMYEDRSGRFWVGTYLTGLFEFDRSKGTYLRQIDERSGLLFNTVNNLKEDPTGRIWIAGDRGLTRLDPRTMKLRTFVTDDMLPGKQLSSLEHISLSDGRFVLSTNDGIALFDPKSLDDDPDVPVVHLESIRYNKPGANDSVAKQVLSYGIRELKLAHDQNSVQFNYIALHYENPAANTYAYMLEGYDKQWVQAGTNRTVTYNNLPPGTYTFKVKAANSSGVWNDKGDSITIVISPPWWFTWWAWVLWVVLFIAAVYGYIRYRSQHLLYENQLLEERVEERTNELTEANKALSEKQEEITAQRDQLEETVNELKSTQQQLIQSEKLASLGELTAGIAHEIQNPLNFINNFSEVSIELTTEMKEEMRSGSKKEALAIASDIELNLEKIVHHGKRADAIVKNMLQHSRTSTGEKQPTDLNALADEYLRLAFHGLRAKDKDFNAELLTDFDPELPKVNAIAQDLGRVLLNMFNNAFYAVKQRRQQQGANYKPVVEVSTRLFTPPNGKSEVRIYVKDNGTGIPDAVKDKILQPFFTTKPTGEGTGLGLSLSHDIIVKGHNGKIEMASTEGEYTEFIVKLPVKN